MLKKISRYYHTLRHLRLEQFYYRIFYSLQKKINPGSGKIFSLNEKSNSIALHFSEGIPSFFSYKENSFSFLHLEKKFDKQIDWNFSQHGKLWNYNLLYFDFFLQPNMSAEEGLMLINNFSEKIKWITHAADPYPVSLRGINWIKFFSQHKIRNQQLDDLLLAQFKILAAKPEYHILGNHLLENGFSLLFGACYFQDEKLFALAKKILHRELDEEILSDGGHFELSTMYHRIILFRLLDCINLLKNNSTIASDLLPLLENKASLMLGWMQQMTFANGEMPQLNDAAENIAPSSRQLFDYAERLKMDTKKIQLKESGYRKFSGTNFELIADVGNIGPDYIPGHAHSDTFSFVLNVNNRPLIIDTGTSTYESNLQRSVERSTFSHNTVSVDGKEQSDCWGGFRVGRKAKIISLLEKENQITASHDGFHFIGATHSRSFSFSDKEITILDEVTSKKNPICTAFLHFHPDAKLSPEENSMKCEQVNIVFSGHEDLILEDYNFAPGFNKLVPAKVLVIKFRGRLETKFIF